MEQRTDILELIEYINPAELDYQDWINVGMALKHEGYTGMTGAAKTLADIIPENVSKSGGVSMALPLRSLPERSCRWL